MRHSLQRVPIVPTRTRDARIPHHYYITCGATSILVHCTLAEANETAREWAAEWKVPLFEVIVKRA